MPFRGFTLPSANRDKHRRVDEHRDRERKRTGRHKQKCGDGDGNTVGTEHEPSLPALRQAPAIAISLGGKPSFFLGEGHLVFCRAFKMSPPALAELASVWLALLLWKRHGCRSSRIAAERLKNNCNRTLCTHSDAHGRCPADFQEPSPRQDGHSQSSRMRRCCRKRQQALCLLRYS